MSKSWDCIVLCAGDQQQKRAFQQQLQNLDLEQFSDVPVRVYVDLPTDVKIGNGGALLVALNQLNDEFGSELARMKILFIPTGGYSQRQPNAAALGKIFSVLPKPTKTGQPMSLLLAKLYLLAPLCDRMAPGAFVCSADTLEDLQTTPSADWSLSQSGFTVIAHRSLPEVGTRHGVYVLENTSPASDQNPTRLEPVVRVLQKPSLELISEAGAICLNAQGDKYVYTDSMYYFSPDLFDMFLDFYAQHAPLQFELDAYGDFLQPLGANATSAYVTDDSRLAVVGATNSKSMQTLHNARLDLYNRLKPHKIQALVLDDSTFYHIGTLTELEQYFCRDRVFQRAFGLQRSVGCGTLDSEMFRGCTIQCQLPRSQTNVVPEDTILEFCLFSANFSIVEHSVLSNCWFDESFSLKVPVFITTIPVKVGYCTVAFGFYDNLKAQRPVSELQYFGKQLKGLLNAPAFQNKSQTSLWKLPLFKCCDSMQKSFQETLTFVQSILETEDYTMTLDDSLYSIADIMRLKDVTKMLQFRKNLQQS